MENYENLGTIGEGTYGVVMKARHKETGQIVAIKKFKESEDDEQVRKTSLREVRVLKQLRHDNIINLLEVFRRKGKLYLVFEYVEKTILELLEKHPYGLDDHDVKRYTYQLLRGVEYCHAHGIVHRDIKPENILISKHGALKLCDFGFARLLSGPGAHYTDYVATRWYRSPELLVGDTEYGKGVDVWAIGCIFAELSNGLPLFPGESDIDQLFHIIKCFGHITPRQGHVFNKNPLYHSIELPTPVELDTLEKRFQGQITDQKWLALLQSCLASEPRHRSSCTELLASAYFACCAFAEKYEEELKQIMEKDAASNLMRLRRQKQRRPRSNTKTGSDAMHANAKEDAPATPQQWAVAPQQQHFSNNNSSHSDLPRAHKAQRHEIHESQVLAMSREPSGLPNLKVQTPRPLPICGFPYNEVCLSCVHRGRARGT
ncbi:Cyclin-dependent kinase A-1 [Diplonema papillatum]|nr:Cyclin-dependent kinase A-1 [Diplonema papillatum]